MKFRSRTILVATLAAASALHGCGGGSLSKQGSVRLLNATTDYASLDLFVSTTGVSSGVAAEAVGAYANVDKGSVTLNLKATGSGGVVATSTQTIDTDKRYTLAAYVSGGTLKTTFLSDDEGAPSANAAKFRVLNASATEAGNVDVYLTVGTCAALPSSAAPTAAAVSGLSTYNEVSVATYRVCVTAAGDKTDLRLDVASISLANQQVATLVLTRSIGGVLQNGLLLNQQGAVTRAPNTSARMRVAASASQAGAVNAVVNGVTLAANAVSPAVTGYRLVPAGALTVTASVSGATAAATGLTATGGADLTLLLAGTAAAPKVSLLADDNTASTSSSNSSRLRLVNVLNGVSGGVTLTYDSAIVADSVPFGSASAATSVAPSTTTSRIEATSGSTSLYLTTNGSTPLAAGRVNSLFLMGDVGAPTGVFRVDR